MTNDNIKSISIKDYLAHQGIYPTKEHSVYGMYNSPHYDATLADYIQALKARKWQAQSKMRIRRIR